MEVTAHVNDDEFLTAQPATLQAREERGPDESALAVADVDAKDLTVLSIDARSDHDCTRHDLISHPLLYGGRVDASRRSRGLALKSFARPCNLAIDLRTDPRHRLLRHLGIAPQSLEEGIEIPC